MTPFSASAVRDVDFMAPGAVEPADFGLDGLNTAAARLSVDLSPTSGLGTSRLGHVRRMDGASILVHGRSWFTVRTAAGPGLLLLDPALATCVADLLLGGPGTVDPRALTSVEERVLVPHLQRAMAAFGSAFAEAGLAPMDVLAAGRGMPGLRGDFLVVDVVVASAGRPDAPDLGAATLAVPAPAMARPAHEGSYAGDDAPAGLGSFASVPLELSVRTGTTPVPAERVRTLQVGELLVLRHRCDTPLSVSFGEVHVASGVLGRHGDAMTVQVSAIAPAPSARASRPSHTRRPSPSVLPAPVAAVPEPSTEPLENDNTEGSGTVNGGADSSPVAAAVAAAEGALAGAGPVTPESPVVLGRLADVPVEVSVEVGRARISLREAVALAPGQVVTLDADSDAPAVVLVNGRVVAHGQIVVVDEVYGVRISELVED